MNILILILAMVGYGDFTNQIALEAAKAKQQAARSGVVALVPRSQCTKCGGTGKITAGDTVTVVTRECDACYDDSKPKAAATGAAPADPKPPAESKPAPQVKQAERPAKSGKRAIFFGATWCGKCQYEEKYDFPALRQQGWSIGDQSCDIEVVDFDARPDLVAKHAVGSCPTLILLWDNREIKRNPGYQNSAGIKTFFASRVGPQYLRQWAAKYTGNLAYTQGMTEFAHLTDPASDENHTGGHFEAWQLIGLSKSELQKLHGGQHNGVLTPFGGLK